MFRDQGRTAIKVIYFTDMFNGVYSMTLYCRNVLCHIVTEVKPIIFVLTYRVRNKLTVDHELVDPDPGKCFSKKMKAECPACNKEPESSVSKTDQNEWTSSTNILPKQFSFCNIQTYTQKSAKEGKTTEKPIRKGYKLFFENYVFDVVGLNVSSCCIKKKVLSIPKKVTSPS